MNRKLFFTFSVVMLAAMLFSAPQAKADSLSLTLDSPNQFGFPGTTFDYYGTLTADSNNHGTLFLNADSFNVDVPFSLDDSGFFFGGPLFMNPGDTFHGLLFSISSAPQPNGTYNGFFAIVGGGDFSAQDTLASSSFSATVPEPGTLLLLGAGLVGLTYRRRA